MKLGGTFALIIIIAALVGGYYYYKNMYSNKPLPTYAPTDTSSVGN